MAQQVPLPSSMSAVSHWTGPLLLLMQGILATGAVAQNPQQQYVFGSVPVTTTTSQVAAFAKNGLNGALTAAPGTPFADSLQGGALAIDGLGHFLFVINTSTSNISMFQINAASGSLTEVPGSPFSTGPTESLTMAATSPVCLAADKSGQFLYVGYSLGNFVGQGALNEYLIDAANLQLVPLPAQPTTDIASAPIGMIIDPRGLHLYVGLGRNPTTGIQDAGTNVYSIDPITGALSFTGTAGNALSAGRSIAMDPQGRFFFDGWGTTLGTIDSALISPADGTAMTGISSVSSSNQIPAAMLAEGTGKFLYVQQGSAPVVYAINQTTGALAIPPAAVTVLTFNTTSAAADPLGPYVYSLQPDGVHGFLVDPQSGALSEVPGSPFGGTVAEGALTISGVPVQAVSGPAAAIFPASQDFGSLNVGQSSNSKLFTLTNTGGQGLSLASLTLAGANPSDFVATPNCSLPTVLQPNASCTISVFFSPVAAGLRQASLSAADNAPGSPQSVPLTGTGEALRSAVTLTPGSLTFASTTQGSTSLAQNITVTSAGAATLHISSVLPGGANPADFQVNSACSGAYPVAASCDINVAFSPLGAGQRTANLTITDDTPDSPQSVQLTGTGAAAPPGTPAIKIAPALISFGTITQGASVSPQTVTLTDSGTGPLHIASVALGGINASDFSMTNNCTAPAYAVGGACTIGISLTPLVAGPRAAFIVITDDTPNSPQTISLTATVNGAFTISPAAPGSSSATVTAGQTAMFNLVLTPGPGFTGSASFACTGSPAAATCSAPSVQFANASPIAYVVSVTTTANTLLPPIGPPLFPPITWLYLFATLACCGAIVRFFCSARLWERISPAVLPRAAVLIALAAVCALGVCGCGAGGTAGVAAPQVLPIPSGPKVSGTPRGTSTITLTPTVLTSTGTTLSGVPPIQLTLTVQ
jgi:6-phosphogluconolactonase (cycloisomerase 2 family)